MAHPLSVLTHEHDAGRLLWRILLGAIVIGGAWLGQAAAETVEFTVSSSFAVRFERNHVVFYERGGGGGGGRGFTVAAVDSASVTGNIINVRTFDTWLLHCTEHDRLAAFLDGFPLGTLLLIAVGDEAGLVADACSERTRRALEVLGSTQIRSYRFRNKWAMIAIKGEGKAITEGLSSAAPPLVVEILGSLPAGGTHTLVTARAVVWESGKRSRLRAHRGDDRGCKRGSLHRSQRAAPDYGLRAQRDEH